MKYKPDLVGEAEKIVNIVGDIVFPVLLSL
jgi:hypothetical protein